MLPWCRSSIMWILRLQRCAVADHTPWLHVEGPPSFTCDISCRPLQATQDNMMHPRSLCQRPLLPGMLNPTSMIHVTAAMHEMCTNSGRIMAWTLALRDSADGECA